MVEIQQLLNAVITGSGTYQAGGRHLQFTFYIIGAGTISTGSLQLETAIVEGYSGTWAPLASAVALTTVSGGKASIVQVNGPLNAVRSRLAVDVTGSGGSVSVYMVAK